MCGLVWGGFWWIFPLIGLVMCIGMMLLMTRVAGRRGGCMGMGGSNRAPHDEPAALRRDIDALREEIRGLKPSR